MRTLLAALALLPATLGAQSDTTRLRSVANPRVTAGSWVTDAAGHLRADTRARIDSIASLLERETSAELAVAVVDSLEGLEPADAALLLHRRWGVGKRERDNGILLLWSPARRQIYVSVGYGLEGVLPDARTGRIQDQSIIPAFRRQDFDGGVIAGVTALAAAAREERYTGLQRARSLSSESGILKVLAGIFGVFALAGTLTLVRLGRYPRRCPRGHGFMKRLAESADNAHLDEAQVLEENLGSVDYDVWACARCDATKIVPHRKLLSSYRACPECKRRTLKRSSKILQAATYTSSGRREVTLSCKNCGYSKQFKETIPQLVRSSGGSSGGGGGGGFSGGSSFGGGSAGGAGAGRSY